jgi:phage-related tail protein
MKTVEGPHIIEMKSNLQAMLEEFHRLLSRYRHHESKVQLLDQLNQRNQKLQCLEEDMNTLLRNLQAMNK